MSGMTIASCRRTRRVVPIPGPPPGPPLETNKLMFTRKNQIRSRVCRQVSILWGAESITNSSRNDDQRDKRPSYCPQRARSVGHLSAVTLSTRSRELASSLRRLLLLMTCQPPWERPCSVLFRRECWHSSSNVAARFSALLNLNLFSRKIMWRII